MLDGSSSTIQFTGLRKAIMDSAIIAFLHPVNCILDSAPSNICINIIHLAQLSNLIGPFVPRDRPEKNDIGQLALTLTQKRQRQVELWQNRTVQGFRPIQRSNCCQSWTIRIAKKVKKGSFVKADSDAAATGNAESEQTRMLFLDFLYNSIVNILPICII